MLSPVTPLQKPSAKLLQEEALRFLSRIASVPGHRLIQTQYT